MTNKLILGSVNKLPGKEKDIAIPQGSTVADVLAQAEIPIDANDSIILNGYDATLETVIAKDNFHLRITRKVSGNLDSIQIRILIMGSPVQRLELNGDRTVETAVRTAAPDIKLEHVSIMVDGDIVPLTHTLKYGDSIVVAKKSKGN